MAVARWPYFTAVVLLLLGVALVIVGGCLVPVFNDLIAQRLRSHVLPTNGSEPFQAWENWSHFQPVYRHFYFFNVSNPEEVIETGKNTTVQEVGPYVYRVDFERRDVRLAESGSRLSYDLFKTYSFERNLSIGAEDDVINNVNLPILNLATRLRFENRTVQDATAKEIGRLREGLFAPVRVTDLLWGYRNRHLRTLLLFLEGSFQLRPLNDSTYGLLYQEGQPKQTTYQGSYVTDISDLTDLWKIKEWNGNSSLNVWNSATCNSIAGTDGYAWPPKLDAATRASLFDPDWCRSFRLSASDRTGTTPGSYGYVYDNRTLAYSGAPSGGGGDDNRGFCQPTPRQNGSCLDDGVLNVTSCKDNIPLLLSQPHFLEANSSYADAIHGLRQNASKHETTFSIEPTSGEVVEAARKMQLNAYVMRLASFPDTSNFDNDDAVLPIVWMDEIYSMTDRERQYLVDESSKVRKYEAVQFVLIGVGVLLVLGAAILTVAGLCIGRRFRADGGENAGERQPLIH